MTGSHERPKAQSETPIQQKQGKEAPLSEENLETLLRVPMGVASTGADAPPNVLISRLNDTSLPPIYRQTMASQIGRMAGNRYLQRLITPTQDRDHAVSKEKADTPTSAQRIQRQTVPDAGAAAPTVPPTAAAPTRPTRSELITIANSAINAEYVSAARDGLNDFESTVGSSFDFGPMAMALAGNLIWAGACFATGGTAFLISLGGIAIGTAAPAASGSIDRPAFHQYAVNLIEHDIAAHLLNQIVRVVDDIDREATANQWNEFQTRSNLLGRLLRPEFISTVAGGLPTVNRAAIAQKMQLDLLIRANSYGPGLLSAGGGRFIYDYTVSNHYDDGGFFGSDTLRPATGWQFVRGATQLYIPQGESAAFNAFQRVPLLQPADMAFLKTIYIHSSGASGDLEVDLDGANNITRAVGYGIFEDFGQAPRRPAARSAPPPADPIGASRPVLAQMWSSTSGRPAWVRGQDLGYAGMPGRSRATR